MNGSFPGSLPGLSRYSMAVINTRTDSKKTQPSAEERKRMKQESEERRRRAATRIQKRLMRLGSTGNHILTVLHAGGEPFGCMFRIDHTTSVSARNCARRIWAGDTLLLDCGADPRDGMACLVLVRNRDGKETPKVATVMNAGRNLYANEDAETAEEYLVAVSPEQYIGTILYTAAEMDVSVWDSAALAAPAPAPGGTGNEADEK